MADNNSYPKGSEQNPYTLEEFESFSEEAWPGGFVETLGYVYPYVVVDGCASGSGTSGSGDTTGSGSDNEDPFDDGFGSGSDDWINEDNFGCDTDQENGSGSDSEDNSDQGAKPKLIAKAEKYIGYSESNNASTIIGWLQAVGITNATTETPWCAAFVAAMFREAGRSGVNNASVSVWKQAGTPVSEPKPGDLAFFKTGSHMGIVANVNGDSVTIIHGNYSNSVVETTESITDLDFRRY